MGTMARKSLGLIIIALLMWLPGAQAAVTATFGDQNSSLEYRMKADTDGVITFASNTGIVYPYERYTSANTNNTLTAAESGKTIVDTGGVTAASLAPVAGNGGSKHILPRAAPGLTYTICSGAKITIDVDTVDTSDTIEHSISGTALDAGDSLRNNGQAGECLTVFSTVANKWTAMPTPANWVDNGTN